MQKFLITAWSVWAGAGLVGLVGDTHVRFGLLGFLAAWVFHDRMPGGPPLAWRGLGACWFAGLPICGFAGAAGLRLSV
jgi:hypothetical protein